MFIFIALVNCFEFIASVSSYWKRNICTKLCTLFSLPQMNVASLDAQWHFFFSSTDLTKVQIRADVMKITELSFFSWKWQPCCSEPGLLSKSQTLTQFQPWIQMSLFLKFLHLDCLVSNLTSLLATKAPSSPPAKKRTRLKWVHMAHNNWQQWAPLPAWYCNPVVFQCATKWVCYS